MPGPRALRPSEQEPFSRLVRTVTRSPRFSLSFAVVNSPLQRQRLVGVLAKRLAPERGIIAVGLHASLVADATASMLDELTSHTSDGGTAGRQVLCAFGIEHALDGSKLERRTLDSLQQEREGYSRRLNIPLVIWLPVFAAG